MDKLQLFMALYGVLVAACGIISKLCPDGSKLQDVFGKLGSLPIDAAKAIAAPPSSASGNK